MTTAKVRKKLNPAPAQKPLWTRVLWWVAWLSSLSLLFVLLGGILAPFVFAFVLAWMLNPLCTRITSQLARIVSPPLCRALAALLLTLLLLALLVLLLSATLPALLYETLELVAAMPKIATTLQSKAQQFALVNPRVNLWVEQWQQLLQPAWESAKDLNPNLSQWHNLGKQVLRLLSQALQTLTQQTSSIVSLLSWFALVPFATFYFLKDWTQAMQACRKRIPRGEEHLLALFRRIDETLSALIRGQAAVLGTMALFYATLLSLVGLPYGFAIGIASGLLMLLPYVGTLLGAGIALIVAYAYSGFALPLLLTLLVFVVGQMLESYFLTPRWVGKRVGLHPLWVVFFVLAGGEIAGFTGILLALPVGATLRAVLVHIDERIAARNAARNSCRNS